MFGFIKKLFSGASSHRDPKFTPQFTSEMQQELEAIGSDTGGSDLTAGMGMIKMGASELLPGWIELFGRSSVYCVSVEDADAEIPFIFGPTEDRTYIAVCTTELLAKQYIAEMPPLKSVIPFTGIDLIRSAGRRELGLWINPLNVACSMKIPAAMVGKLFGTSSPKPPPLPASSTESSDPFIQLVEKSGEHAENEIEGLIGFFRMGIMTPQEFFPAILKKDFITICSERSDPNSALFLSCPNGTSRLALFTSEAKAKKLFELHPSFSHAFDVSLEDLLKGLPTNAGFVVNPTFEAMTLQVSPEQLEHIRADFLTS